LFDIAARAGDVAGSTAVAGIGRLGLGRTGDRCQQCTGGAKTIVGGNTIWSPTGKITECGKDLADWQAEGNDVGTKALPYPADAEVLAIVRQTLKM
jgi:hypothetical protein